jgi:hypothetical protein
MWAKKMSAGAAKRLVAGKQTIDPVAVLWLQDWIENYVRGRSLPPQLCSPDFQPLLLQMLPTKEALDVLVALRAKFYLTFPHLAQPPKVEESEYEAVLQNLSSPDTL